MTVAEYQQAQKDIAEIRGQIAQLRDVVAKVQPNDFSGSPIDLAMQEQQARNKSFADTSLLGNNQQPASTTAVAPQDPTFTAGASSIEQALGTSGMDDLRYRERASVGNPDDVDALQAGDKPIMRSVDESATAFGASMADAATMGLMGEQPKKFQRAIDQSPISSFGGTMAGYAPAFMGLDLAAGAAIPAIAGKGIAKNVARGAIAGGVQDTADQLVRTGEIDPTRSAASMILGASADFLIPAAARGFKSIKEARAAINDIGKPKVDVPEVVQEPIRSETPPQRVEPIYRDEMTPDALRADYDKSVESGNFEGSFEQYQKLVNRGGMETEITPKVDLSSEKPQPTTAQEVVETAKPLINQEVPAKAKADVTKPQTPQTITEDLSQGRTKPVDEYVYHRTGNSPEIIESIKKKGLLRKYAGEYPHGVPDIPDEIPRIYFGESPQKTSDFGGKNILRVKRSVIADNMKSRNMGLRGEEVWYFGDKIHPADIEMQINGEWKPLGRRRSTKPSPDPTTPVAPTVGDKVTPSAKVGNVEPPPVKTETPTPRVDEKPKSVGLNKAEIETIRKDTGIDELPEADREAHLGVLGRAKEGGVDRKALDIAREVKDSPRPITAEEHAGMVLKTRDLIAERKQTIADISNAVENGNDPTIIRSTLKRIDDEIDLLTESSDLGGRESARSLNIRRMRLLMESDDIVYHRQEAQAIKGSKLTPEESARFEKLVADKDAAIKRLDEENAKWQKDYEELQAKQAEALIKHEAGRAKITERIQGKREKIQAERVDILKKLKERGFETKLNAGLDPQDAYLIGKLGMNYVKGGINNIDQVVSLVMADIPNLTRRDVLQSLNAKNPDLQAKAKAQAMIQINHIKRQAELLVKIEDAEKGIFTKSDKSTGATTPIEIKSLQAKLRELRTQSYRTIRDADRLERVQKSITSIQDQLANHYRTITKKAPADPPDVAQLRGQLKDLRRQMKIEDELARLEDQVRTGDFEVPQEIMPRTKSETLDRAEIDLKRARRVIRDEMEKLRPKSVGEKLLRTSENLRAIKATADLSATLRQGAISVVSHPVTAMKNFVPSLKATFSRYKSEQIDMAMRSSDAQYLRDKAKLELTNIDGTPTTREEHFAGVWIEKIPGLGEVVKASNRHMATFLNLMRTSMFDDFVKKVPNATTEELKAYAKWINVTTGRGELGKYAQAGRSLGTVFFAPRFAISRIQTPSVFYKAIKTSPRVRAQVAKEAAAVGATAMGVLALAKMSGAEVGVDPRTSEFGKIRIGNERIDIFAGYQQPMRLVVQAGTAITDRAGITGQYLRDQDKDFDPIDAWMQFAEFKLSPMLTTPTEVIFGKDRLGKDVEPTDALIRSVEPMLVNAIREAWEDDGLGAAARSGSLNFFGVSSNVYSDSENRLRRDIAEAEKKGDLETRNRKKQELKDLQKENKIKKRDSASK